MISPLLMAYFSSQTYLRLRRSLLRLALASLLFVSLLPTQARAESVEKLHSIQAKAGSLAEFVANDQLVEEFYWSCLLYFGGSTRCPRKSYDEIMRQLRILTDLDQGLAEELFRSAPVGSDFAIKGQVSEIQVNTQQWQRYYQSLKAKWKVQAESMVRIDDSYKRNAAIELALTKARELSFEGMAEEQLVQRLHADTQIQAAMAYLLYRLVEQPAFKAVFEANTPSAKHIMQALAELRAGDTLNWDSIIYPLPFGAELLKHFVPSSSRLLKNRDLFSKAKKVDKIFRFRARTPFLALFQFMHLQECIGGSCTRIGWTTLRRLLQVIYSRGHLVEVDGRMEGASHLVPYRYKGETVYVFDVISEEFNRVMALEDARYGRLSSSTLFEQYLAKLGKSDGLSEDSKIIAGLSDELNNANTQDTIKFSRAFQLGDKLPVDAELAPIGDYDRRILAVSEKTDLLKASEANRKYGGIPNTASVSEDLRVLETEVVNEKPAPLWVLKKKLQRNSPPIDLFLLHGSSDFINYLFTQESRLVREYFQHVEKNYDEELERALKSLFLGKKISEEPLEEIKNLTRLSNIMSPVLSEPILNYLQKNKIRIGDADELAEAIVARLTLVVEKKLVDGYLDKWKTSSQAKKIDSFALSKRIHEIHKIFKSAGAYNPILLERYFEKDKMLLLRDANSTAEQVNLLRKILELFPLHSGENNLYQTWLKRFLLKTNSVTEFLALARVYGEVPNAGISVGISDEEILKQFLHLRPSVAEKNTFVRLSSMYRFGPLHSKSILRGLLKHASGEEERIALLTDEGANWIGYNLDGLAEVYREQLVRLQRSGALTATIAKKMLYRTVQMNGSKIHDFDEILVGMLRSPEEYFEVLNAIQSSVRKTDFITSTVGVLKSYSEKPEARFLVKIYLSSANPLTLEGIVSLFDSLEEIENFLSELDKNIFADSVKIRALAIYYLINLHRPADFRALSFLLNKGSDFGKHLAESYVEISKNSNLQILLNTSLQEVSLSTGLQFMAALPQNSQLISIVHRALVDRIRKDPNQLRGLKQFISSLTLSPEFKIWLKNVAPKASIFSSCRDLLRLENKRR